MKNLEHENQVFALMMDALDSNFSPRHINKLKSLLIEYPELRQEWQIIQEIDSLFKETPLIIPSDNFVQDTIAQLPNKHTSIWLFGLFFGLFFLGGILPIVSIIWLDGGKEFVLVNPTLFGGIFQTLSAIFSVFSTIFKGIGQMVSVITQQTIVWGTLFMMIGTILLWSGVYSRLLRPIHAIEIASQ